MKNILVIGGTGFIGYYVAKEAKRRGYRVTSISLRKPIKARHLKDVNYLRIDLSNFKSLKKKLSKDFDYVVNASGYGKHPKIGTKGDKLFETHFYGLLNLLQVLSLKKIKKFIQIGSSAEYGKNKAPLKEQMRCFPKTPYSIAKLTSTNVLKYLHQQEKFPVTILRLFQVYGPNQDENRILPYLIKNCLKNKIFATTSGKQFCDFCYIDDVIAIIFKSLLSSKINGEIINVGSGKPMQIKKIILFVKKFIGKGKPIIGALKYREEMSLKNYPSISKAKRLLSWSPKTNFQEGLYKTIKSYK